MELAATRSPDCSELDMWKDRARTIWSGPCLRQDGHMGDRICFSALVFIGMKWDRIKSLGKLCWRQPLAVKKDLFLSVIAPQRGAGDPLASGGIGISVQIEVLFRHGHLHGGS